MDPNQKVKDAFRTDESRAQFFLNDFNAEPSSTTDIITVFQELVIPYLMEKDIKLLVRILNRNPLLFKGNNVWRGNSYAKLVNEHWEDLSERSQLIIFGTFSHTDKDDETGWTLLQWALKTKRALFHPNYFFNPSSSNYCSPIFHRYPKEITKTDKYQRLINIITPSKGIAITSNHVYFRLFMAAFLNNDNRALSSEMIKSLETSLGWDKYPVRSSSTEVFAWLFESLHKNYINHGYEYSVKTKYLLAFNEILDTPKRDQVVERIISSKPLLRKEPEKVYADLWLVPPSCFSPEIAETLSQKDDDLKKQFYRHFYISQLPMIPSIFEHAIQQRSTSAITFSISPYLPECLNLKAEYEWYEEYYTQEERNIFIGKIIKYLSDYYTVKIETKSLEQLISILETNIEEQYPPISKQKVS